MKDILYDLRLGNPGNVVLNCDINYWQLMFEFLWT